MSDIPDFIPEGQDTGALTGDGYRDFVPAPLPKIDVVPAPVVNEVPAEPTVEEKKTK